MTRIPPKIPICNRTALPVDVIAARWAAELQFNDRRLIRMPSGSVVLIYRENGLLKRVPVMECISSVLA